MFILFLCGTIYLCPLCSYPHDAVNRLSCNEAQNYYGGVVSVIPRTLDLLSITLSELEQASTERVSQTDITASEHGTAADNTENMLMRSSKPACKAADGWKPAWRPPGCRRM